MGDLVAGGEVRVASEFLTGGCDDAAHWGREQNGEGV